MKKYENMIANLTKEDKMNIAEDIRNILTMIDAERHIVVRMMMRFTILGIKYGWGTIKTAESRLPYNDATLLFAVTESLFKEGYIDHETARRVSHAEVNTLRSKSMYEARESLGYTLVKDMLYQNKNE